MRPAWEHAAWRHAATVCRPREFKQSPVGVPMDDEEAHQYVVSGPYAADFQDNKFQGRAHVQTEEQRVSRMNSFFTNKDAWGATWAPEIVETFSKAS